MTVVHQTDYDGSVGIQGILLNIVICNMSILNDPNAFHIHIYLRHWTFLLSLFLQVPTSVSNLSKILEVVENILSDF